MNRIDQNIITNYDPSKSLEENDRPQVINLKPINEHIHQDTIQIFFQYLTKEIRKDPNLKHDITQKLSQEKGTDTEKDQTIEQLISLLDLPENANIEQEIQKMDAMKSDWIRVEKLDEPDKSIQGHGSKIVPGCLLLLKYVGTITWKTCQISGFILYQLILNSTLVAAVALSIFILQPKACINTIKRFTR